MRLGLDLTYGPNLSIFSKNIKTSDTSIRNKKRKDQVLINPFQDFIQLRPDIFEGLDLDDLVSSKPIQNKEKGISRKKNIIGSVKVGLELVKEEKGKEVLEVQISSRGHIIRNTRKM